MNSRREPIREDNEIVRKTPIDMILTTKNLVDIDRLARNKVRTKLDIWRVKLTRQANICS
jgi:hypothetical protein